MIFDSLQQKEMLFQMVQAVPIKGSYLEARQQIIQVEDMLQAINTGEVISLEGKKEVSLEP